MLSEARHRRLSVGRRKPQAELSLSPHDGHLLLELQLHPLRGPGRDRGHAHRERGPARGPGGGPSLGVLLALLQEAGVDALRGQLAVDGPCPLLLEDHAGDALRGHPTPRSRRPRPTAAAGSGTSPPGREPVLFSNTCRTLTRA